ncbi:spore cortex-lytic enzyme [Desulforamulus ruminis]|nr:spore cortex-lytic enzyme [Desulforamulus ruminis]
MRYFNSGRRKMVCLMSLVAFLFAGFIVYNQALAQESTLYWGSQGSKVRAVQQRLKDWGYYKGPVDGVYRGETAAAVRKFQSRNGIPADGVVGTKTSQALGLSTGAKAGTTYTSTPTSTSRGYVSNRDSVNLLARVIMGEAANEPYLGKVAVGAVMLNRTEHEGFPSTLSGVVYQPMAFESVSNGQYNRSVTPEALKAAQDALSGYDPTGGAIYFWNPSKPVNPWIWSRKVVGQIGQHVFAY